MITMDREDTQQQAPLTPGEAVAYLKEHYGVDIKVTALRARRLRGNANATRVLGRTSLWDQRELDRIGKAIQEKMNKDSSKTP